LLGWMLVFLFGLRRVAQGAFKCGRVGGRMARHNDMHSLGFYRGPPAIAMLQFPNNRWPLCRV
jgi:hypothetical protein